MNDQERRTALLGKTDSISVRSIRRTRETDDVLARRITFNDVVVTSHQAYLTRESLANIADKTEELTNAVRNQ